MILLVDNFDSFTFNLVQTFQTQGCNPLVHRNNEPEILDLATSPDLQGVVLSPGPSHPVNAGLCLELLTRLPRHIPVLGVCLGHQILGYFAGAHVSRANRIMHGKTSTIEHTNTGLFAGLPQPMVIGRYHSLIVFPGTTRLSFTVTAATQDGSIMGLAYTNRPWMGVQFHPESVLTPDGPRLLNNFIRICQDQADGTKNVA
ncbi:anthranilate synthase component II [Desulfoplanes formicivorans]|uniref:Anthranilate synthase n=1 Tax=Desulfoplanes formicivorans TaxID=1592317 RepID=A0A194AJH7_9BACT|nr:aminodeoxychorismate/anthranilate synthase component II [Desulfoplanes formicivorans]GAU09473.1 anthranilate synthase [Desulfoplanes formicivorans]